MPWCILPVNVNGNYNFVRPVNVNSNSILDPSAVKVNAFKKLYLCPGVPACQCYANVNDNVLVNW